MIQWLNDYLGLGGQKNEDDYYNIRKTSFGSVAGLEDESATPEGSRNIIRIEEERDWGRSE